MTDMDARINESLKELASRGGGDWTDVIARSGAILTARHRRRVIFAIAIATFLVSAGTTLAIGNQLFGWFRVSTPPDWFSVATSHEKAPATRGALAYVAGQTLYRPHKRPQRLAHKLIAPLLGEDAGVVVSSPDGRYVVYHTWKSNTPKLFVHDTIIPRERVLALGAQTVAWSSDGRIAYFKADHERYDQRNGSYVGQVVVQTLDGEPTVWTRESGGYEVLAWARGELLVQIRYCEFFRNCLAHPDPGVYALNRSGRLRSLHLAKLSALSPDGRYAFGVAGPYVDEIPPSRVRISRVDTGRVVATLNLARPGSQTPVSFLGASWRGSEIVGSTGHTLVFFKLRGRALALESIIRVPAKTLPKKWNFYIGIPFFAGQSNTRVIVSAGGIIESTGFGESARSLRAVLVCSRTKRSCERVTYLPSRPSYEWFAPVDNPSRP